MQYAANIFALAATMTIAFFGIGYTITAIVGGRLKREPSEPWIVFRESPIRFTTILAVSMAITVTFAAVGFRLASHLLH